jgi:hypothetical protein
MRKKVVPQRQMASVAEALLLPLRLVCLDAGHVPLDGVLSDAIGDSMRIHHAPSPIVGGTSHAYGLTL